MGTLPRIATPIPHPSHVRASQNNPGILRSMGNLSNSSSDHSGHNATPSQQVSPIARELGAILKIKVITDKIKDDEVSDAVKADWKFAAMVLDRLCLFFFSAFTVVATLAVLAVAPHIIVY